MTFSEDIDRIVKESNAFDNNFFANCHDESRKPHINDVSGMAVNWYLITKYFGLSAQEYDALLARRLKYASGEKARLLQDLLVESAMISGDDLGIGHERLYAENGGAEIPHNERLHYKLWGDMTKTLIRKAQNIRWPVPLCTYSWIEDETERKEAVREDDRKQRQDQLIKAFDIDYLDGLNVLNAGETGLIHPSTYSLVERIEDEFTSLEGGVAVYQTVESIAYNIVVAYSDLMQRIGSGEMFTERDLVYLEIHKPLEKDHDTQSTRMVDLADQYFGQRYRPVIETKVRELSGLFGQFWNGMNDIVFKGETREPTS